MTDQERLTNIINQKPVDRIPLAPFEELLPRAFFEKEFRMAGCGLVKHVDAYAESRVGTDHCTLWHHDGSKTEQYTNAYGTVWEKYEYMKGASNSNYVQTEYMIKKDSDYDVVIEMLEKTVTSPDNSDYELQKYFMGDEGFFHVWTGEPPYMEAQYFLGLERWSYAQMDEADQFDRLLEALGKRQENRIKAAAKSPVQCMNIANLAGNYSPAAFEKYMVPYINKQTAYLHTFGKKITLHCDATNLKSYMEVLKKCDFDIVEAFTPSPVGDLSLAELRHHLGPDKTIWINFPETIFYQGGEAVEAYTKDLLQSDLCQNKILGFTEMGLMGVDSNNVAIFEEGFRAVLRAVLKYGNY